MSMARKRVYPGVCSSYNQYPPKPCASPSQVGHMKSWGTYIYYTDIGTE